MERRTAGVKAGAKRQQQRSTFLHNEQPSICHFAPRRVVELAVGFLTNGEEAIGEAEREREEERHREDRRARAEDMERREREEAERNLDEGTTAEERFRERRGAGVDTLGTRRGRIEEEIMRRIREEGGQGMNGEDGAEVSMH